MTQLDPVTCRRLIASARLLESDNSGERQAALSAVQRLLPVSLADVLAGAVNVAPERSRVIPVSPCAHWGQADCCLAVLDLTDWERSFLATIRRKPRISNKQQAILAPLYTRAVEASYAR